MRVGAAIVSGPLTQVPEAVRRAESLGYDFLTVSETAHNPFLSLTLAAEHTGRVKLKTSIALAFARSPMDTAYLAWGLQSYSGGRLVLGLGSQVRGHIQRRYSMEWSSPAPRMREYIAALRAIWDCWQNGSKLSFRGDFYSFNLMPPAFNPGPIDQPGIEVHLAAVNPQMLSMAGEVCDGVVLHSFNTPRYTREMVLPSLERGAARSGRAISDLDIYGGGFVVTGDTDEELEANIRATRNRIAFYASTPAYARVMAAHGWEDTAHRLYRMSVDGRWEEMGAEVTDEMLEAFAVVGDYGSIVEKMRARYGAYATSISFSLPAKGPEDDERLKEMIGRLQAE